MRTILFTILLLCTAVSVWSQRGPASDGTFYVSVSFSDDEPWQRDAEHVTASWSSTANGPMFSLYCEFDGWKFSHCLVQIMLTTDIIGNYVLNPSGNRDSYMQFEKILSSSSASYGVSSNPAYFRTTRDGEGSLVNVSITQCDRIPARSEEGLPITHYRISGRISGSIYNSRGKKTWLLDGTTFQVLARQI